MPNYRYNMPEYERRNNYGNYSHTSSHRQTGCNVNRESCAAPQPSCEPVRNSCEVPQRPRCNAGEMSCAVNDSYDTLAGMPAAMAYVPWTMWRDIYDDEKALCQGTIFKELDKPFRWIGGAC